jgi:hypothetical protein
MSTLSALMKDYRRRADDRALPNPYVDDALLTDWFNEAETEACIRARLLIDNDSVLSTIQLKHDRVEYPLDSRILEIEHARIPGRTLPLQRCDYDEIAFDSQRKLERGNLGEPRQFALRDGPARFPESCRRFSTNNDEIDQHGLRLVLDRPPNTDLFKTISLVVRRLPLTPMAVPSLTGRPIVDPTPEINPQYHRYLVLWPLHLAFDGRDQDRGDPKRAQNYEDRFDAFFGKRPSADTERKRLRHRPTIIAPDSTFQASGNTSFRRYRPRPDPT